MDFPDLPDYREKNKRKQKDRQILVPYKRTKRKKTVGYEGSGGTNSSWYTRNLIQRLGKETGRTGNQRKNQDHSDHSIVKLD